MRCLFTSLLLLLALSASAADYYVAPGGSDGAAGDIAHPFATLAHAETMHGNVYVRSGTYYLTNTLVLTSADSGATWAGYNGETVTILGSSPVINWQTYSGSIKVADVSTQSIASVSEVWHSGVKQILARWPNYGGVADPYGTNSGFAFVADNTGVSANSFVYSNADNVHFAAWTNAPGVAQVNVMALLGYWNYILPVSAINTNTHTVTISGSVLGGGISTNCHYFVQNVFQELDIPGEWYYASGKLYYWPSNTITGSEVHVPVLANLVTIGSGASNIVMRGLTFAECSSTAVTMSGTNCSLISCIVSNTGDYSDSSVIVSGTSNGVSGCTVVYSGRSAIEITGGNPTNLTAAANYVTNCWLRNFGQDFSEGSGVNVQGVGNVVTHNLIQNGPRFGIYFAGENLVIDHNELGNVMLGTDDGGVIYTEGINWWESRGSVVLNNYFHDARGWGFSCNTTTNRGIPYLSHGIYLDHMSHGVTVASNIVRGVSGHPLFINGGSDHRIFNNIFTDSWHQPSGYPAVQDQNNYPQHEWDYGPGTSLWINNIAAWTAGWDAIHSQAAWSTMPDFTTAPTNHVDPNGGAMWSNSITRNVFDYSTSPNGYLLRTWNIPLNRNTWSNNAAYYGGSPVQLVTNSTTLSWAQWQGIPEDANSSTSNPLLNTNTWQVGSVPLALGFQQIQINGIGPQTNIIPSDRLPAAGWVPGVTVGVRGGIPAPRTNIIDVTQPPYNADNTGASSAVAAITAAITAAAAVSNDVVYLPAGTYDITSGLALRASHITLRGSGSNTVLVGSINAGNDPNVSVGYTFTPTNGYSKGSTSLLMSNVVDQWGTSISPGDAFIIDSQLVGDANWQYIASNGGEPGIGRALRQPLLVTGKTGNTMTVTPPLAWDFTNNTQLHGQTQLGISSIGMYTGVGIENLTLTTTNGGLSSSAVFMLKLSMLTDSWVTNCWLLNGYNYNLYCEDCLHCEIAHNQIGGSRGVGSNHAGLLVARDSGCLFQDNIIADGLSPGLEYNDGFVGNAVFGNFFTNNNNDVVMHNTHPCMNLWEENVSSGFEIDGYFGSCSHETLLRNNIAGTIAIKRWTSYIQVVGNVIGSTSYPFQYLPRASGYGPPWAILEVGYPNIGNENFDGVAGPISWNWPGNHMAGFYGEQITNGVFTITSTQLNTNVLWGNFTNLWPVAAHGNWSQYVLLFQDAANTNAYWNPVAVAGQPTTSNVLVGAATSVTNGQRIYVVNQNAYQWLDTSNLYTDILTGNSVCTNQSSFNVVWDASGSQSIPASFLYTNGAPPWWGTNRWPAIDPVATVALTPIPAQLRYLGIPNPPPPTTNIGGIFSFGGRPILRNGP